MPEAIQPSTTRRALFAAALALPAAVLAGVATAGATTPDLQSSWSQELGLWRGYEDQVAEIAKIAQARGLSPDDVTCIGTMGRGFEKKRLEFYFGDWYGPPDGSVYSVISAAGGYQALRRG